MVMPGSVTLTVSAYVPAGTRIVSPGSATSTAAWMVVVTTIVSPAAWLLPGTATSVAATETRSSAPHLVRAVMTRPARQPCR